MDSWRAGLICSVLAAIAAYAYFVSFKQSASSRTMFCSEKLSEASRKALNVSGVLPPPKPPSESVAGFTMEGSVPLEYFYVDDTNKGRGTHYKYSLEDIELYVGQATRQSTVIYRALEAVNLELDVLMRKRKWTRSSHWLIMALHKYPINGSRVLVYGSIEPWFEAIALAFNAQSVTTIEYNNLTYPHPLISTTTPDKLYGSPAESLNYDVAFSISSFDHDGLGRYGDPIDPDGDLKAMQHLKCAVKEGGKLFLTVPIGPDVTVWNLHRRYGSIRLPKLLDGWFKEDVVGWMEANLVEQASWRQTYEPVFVLRNTFDSNN